MDEGSATSYIEPLQDLPSSGDPLGWTATNYDTAQDAGKGDPDNGSSGWQAGVHGVGMADGDDNTLVVFDSSVYSIYTRTEFNIVSAAAYQGMTLAVDYDDGYIAWLNGVEIHRSSNMVGVAPRWNAATTLTHESSNARLLGPPIDLNAFTSALQDGTNVLAIGTWNFGPVNSDMTLIPRLTLYDQPYAPLDPFHCYLTWQHDTSTTITVNYHTHTDTAQSLVYYDTVSCGGLVANYSHQAAGATHHVPGLDAIANADRAIHVVELSGLDPNQDYYFIAGDSVTGWTDEKKFRTVPPRDDPLRFITGGDMSVDPVVRDLMTQAAATDPMFALLGGDIAYVNGALTSWELWDRWLDWWEELMVTPQGCSVPIVMAVGNHEVAGGFDQFADPGASAPFYFGYFAQHGAGVGSGRRAYFSRSFGANMVVLVLDSGHVTAVDGAQTSWLENELRSTSPRKNTFALYHVPMYPSHRDFLWGGSRSVSLRDNWLPLFDAYRLTAGLENHDHMCKRTKRLRSNLPHPMGTVYIGDGCFGQQPRTGDQAQALEQPGGPESVGLTETYLAHWEARRHFWLVDFPAGGADGGGSIDFTAIDQNGVAFDTFFLESDTGIPVTGPVALNLLTGLLLLAGIVAMREVGTRY